MVTKKMSIILIVLIVIIGIGLLSGLLISNYLSQDSTENTVNLTQEELDSLQAQNDEKMFTSYVDQSEKINNFDEYNDYKNSHKEEPQYEQIIVLSIDRLYSEGNNEVDLIVQDFVKDSNSNNSFQATLLCSINSNVDSINSYCKQRAKEIAIENGLIEDGEELDDRYFEVRNGD